MTIESNLNLMIDLQNKLNTYVLGRDWVKSEKADWLRAAWIECAELMDHCCYKWWKKQEVNLPQAQIELVDIWHFLLSDFIVLDYEDGTDVLIDAIVQGENFSDGMTKGEKLYDTDIDDTNHRLDVIEGLVFSLVTGREEDYFADFFTVCKSLELSFESLTKQYIAKNILNIFRQDNGYKEGKYIKQWPSPIEANITVEDNVYLEMFIAEVDESNMPVDEMYDYVYQRLLDNYPRSV